MCVWVGVGRAPLPDPSSPLSVVVSQVAPLSTPLSVHRSLAFASPLPCLFTAKLCGLLCFSFYCGIVAALRSARRVLPLRGLSGGWDHRTTVLLTVHILLPRHERRMAISSIRVGRTNGAQHARLNDERQHPLFRAQHTGRKLNVLLTRQARHGAKPRRRSD